jgi:hypothetical protein
LALEVDALCELNKQVGVSVSIHISTETSSAAHGGYAFLDQITLDLPKPQGSQQQAVRCFNLASASRPFMTFGRSSMSGL